MLMFENEYLKCVTKKLSFLFTNLDFIYGLGDHW
jgi:hypothetical protein